MAATVKITIPDETSSTRFFLFPSPIHKSSCFLKLFIIPHCLLYAALLLRLMHRRARLSHLLLTCLLILFFSLPAIHPKRRHGCTLSAVPSACQKSQKHQKDRQVRPGMPVNPAAGARIQTNTGTMTLRPSWIIIFLLRFFMAHESTCFSAFCTYTWYYT